MTRAFEFVIEYSYILHDQNKSSFTQPPLFLPQKIFQIFVQMYVLNLQLLFLNY